jgi:DNA repair photolyase
MTPILPFINDTKENIEGLLGYCMEAEVKGILIFGIGMTLRYGNREYYYKKLDEHFPGLKREYMKKFGSAYGIKSPYNTQLTKLVKGFCKENSMLYGEKEIFEYCLKLPEQDKQLTLWNEE